MVPRSHSSSERNTDFIYFFGAGGKSEREKQIAYINTFMWDLKKIGIDDLIYEAKLETRM